MVTVRNAAGVVRPARRSAMRATVALIATVSAVGVGACVAGAVPTNAATTAAPSGGAFVAVAPHPLTVRIAAGSTRAVTVAGIRAIPTGVRAAALSLSTAPAGRAGYLVAAAAGTPVPAVRTLTWRPGSRSSVTTAVQLSSKGQVALVNRGTGPVTVTVIPSGYYTRGPVTAPGMFTTTTPARVATVTVAAHAHVRVSIAGHANVPSRGAAAVFLSTTVHSHSAGTLTTAASGDARGATLPFAANQTVTGTGVVRLSGGAVTLTNASARRVRVNLDIEGYTRAGATAATGTIATRAPGVLFDTAIAGRATAAVQTSGRGGIPAHGASAALLEVVTSTPRAAGGIVTTPAGSSRAGAAALPVFATGQRASALVIARIGDAGKINVYNSARAAVRVTATVLGWVRSPSTFTWSPRRLVDPPTGQMTDISCTTATRCIAVDRTGNALSGGSGHWSAPRLIDPGHQLLTVACTSANFCLALDGDAGAVTYSGTSWSARHAGAPAGLTQLTCTSATFCLASDSTGRYSRYNGTGWSTPGYVGAAAGRQVAIACTTGAHCVAVTDAGDTATYNGTVWSALTHLTRGLVTSTLACTSAPSCIVLGSDDAVAAQTYTFDGAGWSLVAGAGTPATYLDSVSCSTPTYCAGVVSDGADQTGWAFDGATWTSTGPLPSAYEVLPSWTISCASGGCNLVANLNTVWFTGGAWHGASAIDPEHHVMVGVSCSSTQFCAAVGEHNAVLYHGVDAWTRPVALLRDVPAFDGDQHDFTSIDCAAATWCAAPWNATEDDGVETPAVTTYDGAKWTLQPATAHAQQVSCPTTTFCMGVQQPYDFGDTHAEYSVYSNGTWGDLAELPDGSSYGVSDVSCTSATFCIAVGGDATPVGTYWRWNGTSWTRLAAAIPLAGGTVSCATAAFCVQYSGGQASVFDGATWSTPATIASGDPAGVSCTSASFCIAASKAGAVSTYNGTSWSAPATIDAGGLVDVSCASSTFCVAVDPAGNVVYGH